MQATMTTKSTVTTRNGYNPLVDWVIIWCYNRYIQTQKEPKMTDAQIIVTVLVVAVVFAVKVWILTKI